MRTRDGKVRILKDCEGKIDIDHYFEEEDIPKLVEFLKSIGIREVTVQDDEESFAINRPFRYYKPSLQKKMAKDVDWENPKVIEVILTSNQDDKAILKELVKISGRVKPEESQATTFTVIARFRHVWREYDKWRRENKITETPENREQKICEFAPYYVNLIKQQRQKRVPVDTRVFVTKENKNGTILEFEEGQYRIKDDEGFVGTYVRKEFEVLDKSDLHKK